MKKGAITVYLSLTILIFMSLFFTVIEGARVNAMQVKIECAADLAYDSALAEYHRELLDSYGLFFIDTSYGMSVGTVDLTADHIKKYAKKNIDPASEHENEAVVKLAKKATGDFYRLSVTNVEMEQVSFATDHNGEVLREQAIDYMKNVYGVKALETVGRTIIGKNESAGSSGYSEGVDQDEAPPNQLEEELDSASEALIQAYEEELKKKKKTEVKEETEASEEIEEVNIHDVNPAEKVERVGNGLILSVLMQGDVSSLSVKGVRGDFISKRGEKNKGNMPLEKDPLWEEALEKVIFGEYIMEKGGYYGSGTSHTCLDYGAEYVIAGKNSDKENLSSVMYRIFALRGIMNYSCLKSDGLRQELIKLLAAAISFLLQMDLTKVLIPVFTAAWAYIETTVECRDLMHGKKVPVKKTPQNWRTSINEFVSITIGENNCADGIGYEDYVRFFLCFKSNRTQAFRMMDLIEMNVRETPGNGHFRIDSCINAFQAITYFSSDYGYDFMIKRKRYYNTGVTVS